MKIQELDNKTQRVFDRIEARGLLVNREVFVALETALKSELDALEADLGFSISPTNITNHLQAKGIVMKSTKSGKKAATGADALLDIETDDPNIKKIIKANSVKSLWATARSLATKVDGDNKLYPKYRFDERLGRVHAAEVNYLNWTEDCKKAIVARPGYKLVSADYAQFDLRVVAALSGDQDLLAALNSTDMHRTMASKVFEVSVADVTPEQREANKAVIYGMLYGQTPHGLSRKLKCSEEHAKTIQNSVFSAYPVMAKYLETVKAEARKAKKVATYFGRERDLTDLLRTDYSKALRLAVSHKVQSTAGDLMRLSIVKLGSYEEQHDVRLIGQIHDSAIMEVPQAWTEKQVQDMFQATLLHPEHSGFKLSYDVKQGL